jgi:hypothetical protein
MKTKVPIAKLLATTTLHAQAGEWLDLFDGKPLFVSWRNIRIGER